MGNTGNWDHMHMHCCVYTAAVEYHLCVGCVLSILNLVGWHLDTHSICRYSILGVRCLKGEMLRGKRAGS